MDTFVLPPETHIGQVELKIAALDRALEFYAGVLGFQVSERNRDEAALSPHGSDMPLIHLQAIPDAKRKPPRTTGLYHAAIRLPDRPALGAMLRRLLEQRYPLQGAADHLVSEAIYLADPDGNGLELYTDRPREKWPQLNGQISMATDPLDAQGLLRDASPTWDGIHPATDIGHMHLQVSDLAQAEEFYCDLLGFEVTQRSYPGALFISAGGYHHHIGLNVWSGLGAPPPPQQAVGLGYFQVAIPDKTARQVVIERVSAVGIDTLAGTNGTLLIRDPDGNQISL